MRKNIIILLLLYMVSCSSVLADSDKITILPNGTYKSPLKETIIVTGDKFTLTEGSSVDYTIKNFTFVSFNKYEQTYSFTIINPTDKQEKHGILTLYSRENKKITTSTITYNSKAYSLE